jgi:uncharacterized repeat protein (TIGR03803 family)
MSELNWMMKACGVFLLWAAAAVAVSAQTFTTLVNFDGTNGASPAFVSLVQGLDGNFYGTTLDGGANGSGTVFKVTPTGILTTLYSFCSQKGCTDGSSPLGGLALGADGSFYGTTYIGGTTVNRICRDGCGTVFKITPQGILTTLHSFNLSEDGNYPYAQLIQGTDGNFYGTTVQGPSQYGAGTVFEITPGGLFKTLYRFNLDEGGGPIGGLVQATDGNFYGTTSDGGANSAGTVYQFTPGGAYSTLYNFCSLSGCEDGGYSSAALFQGSDGSLYGTTEGGGLPLCYEGEGCGTIFKVTLQGALTNLYSFTGPDGSDPYGPVIQATDGNFYGTTNEGGNSPSCSSGCGTIYKITTVGILTTLHDFDVTDGYAPEGGLVQGTNGSFYGTTLNGGSKPQGTAFALSVGVGPFVESLPPYGKVGAGIRILGTNLTGTTSVTFNGMPAIFTVQSKSEITTTVPAGATTGNVQVTTPTATLISNVAFTVDQ